MKSSSILLRFIGLLALCLAFYLTPLRVASIAAPDGVIESHFTQTLLYIIEIVVGVAGLALLILPNVIFHALNRWQIKLLVCGFLGGVFLLEVACQIWLYRFATAAQFERYASSIEMNSRPARFLPHPYLSYQLAPNFVSQSGSHNRLGYRGRLFSDQSEGPYFRIICVGGSTTYGWGIAEDEDTYPAQLEKMLRAKFANDKIEVLNAGVNGYSSWESLLSLMLRLREMTPDLIINFDGMNDVHTRLVDPASFASDNTGFRRSWSEPSLRSRVLELSILLRMLRTYLGLRWPLSPLDFTKAGSVSLYDWRAKGADEHFKSLFNLNDTRYFERNLRTFVEVSRASQIKLALLTFPSTVLHHDFLGIPSIQRALVDHNRIVSTIGSSYGIPVLDLAQEDFNRDLSLWRDGMHLNAQGATAQAGIVSQFIADKFNAEVRQKLGI